MADETGPPGGTDTVLAPPLSAGDDASIVWLRDPADDEDPAVPDEGAERTPARLWTDTGAQEFRDRWWDIQVRFVDDPDAAVRDAEALVVGATEQLAANVTARGADDDGTDDDTERLRLVVRRYRDLLDRILEL